jgi:hypothetical protein
MCSHENSCDQWLLEDLADLIIYSGPDHKMPVVRHVEVCPTSTCLLAGQERRSLTSVDSSGIDQFVTSATRASQI